MITLQDIDDANYEAANADKPWVRLSVIGPCKSPGSILCLVVGGDYESSRPVTIQSMLDLGLRVEVVR